MTILAFDPKRRTNADLIADAAELGYIQDPVFDVTYGEGNFWLKFKPLSLTTSDLRKPADLALDYLEPMPEVLHGEFATVVFDPPYKLNGTPTDTDRYGADEAMAIEERMRRMRIGLLHVGKLVAPGGHLLAKCQDQIACGKLQQQQKMLVETMGLGYPRWRLEDRLHLTHTARPQRSQKHARHNYSTLLVFRRPARG